MGGAATYCRRVSARSAFRSSGVSGLQRLTLRRRSVSAPMLARNTATARRPHPPTAGAGAVVLVHVPRCPGRSHRSCGLVQAVSQHTSATQNPVEHCDGVMHAPPWGTGVLVGVAVGGVVAVAVFVAVAAGGAVVGVGAGVGGRAGGGV